MVKRQPSSGTRPARVFPIRLTEEQTTALLKARRELYGEGPGVPSLGAFIREMATSGIARRTALRRNRAKP